MDIYDMSIRHFSITVSPKTPFLLQNIAATNVAVNIARGPEPGRCNRGRASIAVILPRNRNKNRNNRPE
jgi:hypothetical protein